MEVEDISEIKPSRPVGKCLWCRWPAMIDVRLGSEGMTFLEGDVCHSCLGELINRYPEENRYFESLVEAEVSHELIARLMRQRFVKNPRRHQA